MNIETLRTFLKEHGNLAELSRQSNVSVRTLFRLRDQPGAGINFDTACKLREVMDELGIGRPQIAQPPRHERKKVKT